MLVTPRNSVRTVMPATTVANHMKLRRRENAGRSNWIAFHQSPTAIAAVPDPTWSYPWLSWVGTQSTQ